MGFIALQNGQVPDRKYISVGFSLDEQADSDRTNPANMPSSSKPRLLFILASIAISIVL
jgi:hypothetical protein